jgi:hypothetical protein
VGAALFAGARGGFDPGSGTPSTGELDRAMAHVMLPSLLYREQRYRTR